ncbi:MAG: SpoIID/LytB domain-containing protein [Bacteroidetes bacterium]|nr:SpoIID/LytB domain-containing protein [Bacteroidota bacterium]
MRTQAILITLLLLTTSVFGVRDFYIGILGNEELHEFEYTVVQGAYDVWAEGELVLTIRKDQTLVITSDGMNELIMSNGTSEVMKDRSQLKAIIIRFIGKEPSNEFRIEVSGDASEAYGYQDDLLITNKDSTLNLINVIGVESYLQGVIKAEIGNLYDPEFLKTMAVVSRTYAIRNIFRHYTEGYDLCDNVHCQVFIGIRGLDGRIVKAIRQTEEEVIVDEEYKIIQAVYHSNSGGLTESGGAVWTTTTPYLQSKIDTFSRKGKHYFWTYQISTDSWEYYLSKKMNEKVTDYALDTLMLRRPYYSCQGKRIPMQTIRKDLGLKSTLFVMKQRGDQIKFIGRGYGHGVGLSQEGAFRMSRLGFTYEETIYFYYTNVEIVSYKIFSSFHGTW